MSPSAIDLVKRLLCVDSKKRITLEQIFSHPWMKVVLGRGKGRGGQTILINRIDGPC